MIEGSYSSWRLVNAIHHLIYSHAVEFNRDQVYRSCDTAALAQRFAKNADELESKSPATGATPLHESLPAIFSNLPVQSAEQLNLLKTSIECIDTGLQQGLSEDATSLVLAPTFIFQSTKALLDLYRNADYLNNKILEKAIAWVLAPRNEQYNDYGQLPEQIHIYKSL